ncbi:MAG: hypothetical protein K6A67_05470 [Bacteroidales bacterium]|nr:hypothetical protein [Bacteroidales bacterium]
MANKSSELRVRSSSLRAKAESVESVEKVDSVVVEHCDSLLELTTVTIQTNDKGDTLKISTITDRTSVRERDRVRFRAENMKVRVDTVYVVKDSIVVKDSLVVKELPRSVRKDGGSGKNSLNAALTSSLKWLFFVLLAILAIIILFRVKR